MNLPGFYFGENVPQLLTFYVPVTGGVTVAGTSPIQMVWVIYEPTGGAVIGGSAPVSTVIIEIYEIEAPVGGVMIGGAAEVDDLFVDIHTIEPFGGVRLAGAAVVLEAIPIVPLGGVRLAGAAIVQEVIPFTASGGVVAGGSSDAVVLSTIVPEGGAIIAGAAPVALVYAAPVAGGVTLGGGATIADYQAWYAPAGGVELGGNALAYALPAGATVTTENPYNRDFPGWAVNVETNVPSRYARLPANSFCQFNGRTYLANAGGIYELGGDDDAGEPIRASVQIPTSDFGSENSKNIPDVFIGMRSTGQMRLSVSTNLSRVRRHYPVHRSDDLRVSRVPIGLGLEGRYWDMEFANTDGCDFDLESIAFTPTVFARHGK